MIPFNVEIKNPEILDPHIVPWFFQTQWLGQQSVNRARLNTSFYHDDEIVYCWFRNIVWAKFSSGPKDPFRRVDLCMQGEGYSRLKGDFSRNDKVFTKFYGKIWMDLSNPAKNCGMTLAPVSWGMDGKPQ